MLRWLLVSWLANLALIAVVVGVVAVQVRTAETLSACQEIMAANAAKLEAISLKTEIMRSELDDDRKRQIGLRKDINDLLDYTKKLAEERRR